MRLLDQLTRPTLGEVPVIYDVVHGLPRQLERGHYLCGDILQDRLVQTQLGN